MPDDAADGPTVRRGGLFPCEVEIARRLSQSEKRWRRVARLLEREGLPKIDPIMGGRFWPAIVAFFEARYGVRDSGTLRNAGSGRVAEPGRAGARVRAGKGIIVIPGPPDGEENWDAR
jgi:hypothetical protein